MSNEDYSFKKSGVEGKEKWEKREYGRIKGWLDILKKVPFGGENHLFIHASNRYLLNIFTDQMLFKVSRIKQ